MNRLTVIEHIQRIDELQLRYKSDKPRFGDSYNILAHGGNVWLLGDEVDPRAVQDIAKTTGLPIENLEDIYIEIDDRPDMFLGQYDTADNKIHFTDHNIGHHPVSSPLLKKLAQHFDVDAITSGVAGYEGDGADVDYSQSQMKGKMPDIMYHGTTTEHINDISRKGLNPNSDSGNWDDVGKFPLVYLTTEFATATFHANRGADNSSEWPLVLQVRIPDPSQFVPDYDVANTMIPDDELEIADELGYTGSVNWGGYNNSNRKNAAQVQKHSKGIDPIATTGLAGYRQRIPAKFITTIYANFSEEGATLPPDRANHEITEFDNWDEFNTAWDIVQDYGHWYEGMEDEMEEYEDEDDW